MLLSGMVSAEKLIGLLDHPERFSFQTLNYGETIGVKLKGEKSAWLCGVAMLGGFDEWPEDKPLPLVTEEQLAETLNSLP